MIVSVSKFSGMSGIRNTGNVSGSAPRSSTRRTSKPKAMLSAVRMMMQRSGEGIAFVKRGAM